MRETAQAAGLRADVPVSELAAFEAELAPLLVPAYRLALGMLLDRSLAEDAVQEASLRAWDRRGRRLAGTEMRPWFFAIVANGCRDARQHRWTRLQRTGTIPDPPSRDPEDVGGRIDLARALQRLPRRSRQAIVLRFYLDLPYDEVAAVLGCSANAAKLRVARAAAALRGHLDEP